MELFHGSNIEVNNPVIYPDLRALDFGAGFYLTSNKTQAIKWAKIVTKRRQSGKATISIYNFAEQNSSKLKILHFETANADWLDFVVKNRKNISYKNPYDLVIGPVANDYTLPVIDDYMDGIYTKEEAVKRLLPQNLTDQHAFLTNNALTSLLFERSKLV